MYRVSGGLVVIIAVPGHGRGSISSAQSFIPSVQLHRQGAQRGCTRAGRGAEQAVEQPHRRG